MRIIRLGALFGCLCILGISSLAYARQNTCPQIVETALETTEVECAGAARNQACYGHLAISAEPRPDAATTFTFDRVGDIVNVADIQTLQLSPLDVEAGAWGVALLRVQANLPSTLPGQNVTVLVFGDTEITNLGDSIVPIEVTAQSQDNGNINVRLAPSTDSLVLGGIASGETVTATGRTENTDWVLVQLPDFSGWVKRELVATEGDLETLTVVEPGQRQYGPMQAIYLRTGVGQPACEQVPSNGILVQTPQGAGTITMAINQIEVEFGSTLFFRAQPGNQMVISVLEGAALVENAGRVQPAVRGGRIRIPVNDNLVPSGPMSDFEPYDNVLLAPLPVDHLERDIEIAPSVTQDEANILNQYERYFERIELKNYNPLFEFLTQNPAATDTEITAFIQSQLDDARFPSAPSSGETDDNNGSDGTGDDNAEQSDDSGGSDNTSGNDDTGQTDDNSSDDTVSDDSRENDDDNSGDD